MKEMETIKAGRIVLTAILTNTSPISIGSGRDDHSDRDVVTTSYPIDTNCRILPPEKIKEAAFMKELPFIPATSFMGKIYSLINNTKQITELENYWGKVDTNASYIDCNDILLTELPSYAKNNSCHLTEIRDGNRIDSINGTVAQGAKFDYELIGPGAKFSLTMTFRVEGNFETAYKIASTIAIVINHGIDLGAKSTVGFGRIQGEAKLFKINFGNPVHLEQWIQNKLTLNELPLCDTSEHIKKTFENTASFEITASFNIKNSLIIRSYSKDPEQPDTTHLKSGGQNILSGSSIKGAMRGRAERILNTIQKDENVTTVFLAALFGDAEKEEDNKQTVKRNGYTIPSRISVDEIVIDDDTVSEEIQTRIKIDRFTGGTVDGALIEEVPLFPIKDKVQIKNFRIQVYDAQPADKGLILLLLKDLWTADLPIGGEKSIGRGVLKGIAATIKDGNQSYIFSDVLKKAQELKELQNFVDALNTFSNYSFYKDRVEQFKNKRK
jgi:CRISPR/Cas system CSM-associated protein Csm3 (group 7 of RAMP superfamily)